MNEDDRAATPEPQGLPLASPPPNEPMRAEGDEGDAEDKWNDGIYWEEACHEAEEPKAEGEAEAEEPKAEGEAEAEEPPRHPDSQATPPQPPPAFKSPPAHIPAQPPKLEENLQHPPPAKAPPGYLGPPGKMSLLPSKLDENAGTVWAMAVSANEDSGIWSNLQDSERLELMTAGSTTMKRGMSQLLQNKKLVEKARMQFGLTHGTISEDSGDGGDGGSSSSVNDNGSVMTMSDSLGDRRNLLGRRPAPQPKKPPRPCRLAGTPSRIPPSWSLDDVEADIVGHIDSIEGSNIPVHAKDHKGNKDCKGYTWVKKWKGLEPGQEIPPVDMFRALKFQNDGGDANERFDQDVVENDGIPKFLCNQIAQEWVVPY